MNKITIVKCLSIFIIFFSKFFYIPRITSEIDNLKKYFLLCKEGTLINKRNFQKVKNPKISIITPVFNREKYLLRFIRSIQNQNFQDIEILLIDDFSLDNSTKIIEELINEDERIVLLKNKKNKGTLISRNIAGLKAKGEYLIFPDPDDIMSPIVLDKCYYTAKRFNFEFIRFYMYSDRYYVFSRFPNITSKVIYSPELRVHSIYGLGYSNMIDGILNNKFITKLLFIKCLNSINEYYLKKNLIYFEDGLINFSFYLNAKSLYLLRNIGYYYFFNTDSISQRKKINSYFECFFIFLKYVYENTKNTILEKNMTFYLLQNFVTKNEVLYNITNYSKIYIQVVNEISKCDFISTFFQSKLKNLTNVILNIKRLHANKI